MYIHQSIENIYCSEEAAPPLQIFFFKYGNTCGSFLNTYSWISSPEILV